MKIGFLIIDMQTVHLEGMDKKAIDRACEYINYVSDKLRSKGQLVVHIQDMEGMSESNKEHYQTIPGIDREETDIVVAKEFSNAFWNTELEQVLKDQGIELLILAGTAAEHCVLFTYNGAVERGFRPVILQNGVLSSNSDAVTSLNRDRNVVSYPVVPYLIHE